MGKKKKNKKLILAIVAVIFILIALNLLIFLNKPSSVYCYKDVCIKGKTDPLAEIRTLIGSSSKAIIVVEQDQEASQKNEFLMGVFVALAKDFGNKKEQIVGIAMKDGTPLRCVCTTNFNSENFTNCPANSTSYCESIVPGEGEIMLKVYYPNFATNEIIVENRTIKFQTKSGQDALAVVNFFGDFFIRNVIR